MRQIERIDIFLEEISKRWKEVPDMRFGQLLINLGVVQDGAHWNYEDNDILQRVFGLKPEDFIFWGSYGINGDEPIKYRLLKDLDTDHIQAILDTQTHISNGLRDTFNRILEERKSKEVLKVVKVVKPVKNKTIKKESMKKTTTAKVSKKTNPSKKVHAESRVTRGIYKVTNKKSTYYRVRKMVYGTKYDLSFDLLRDAKKYYTYIGNTINI